MKKKLKCIIGCVLATVCLVGCTDCSEYFPTIDDDNQDPNGVWECRYTLNSNKTECTVGDWTSEYKKTHKYLDYVFYPSHIGGVPVVEIGCDHIMGTYHHDGRGKAYLPYTIKSISSGFNEWDKYYIMISGERCDCNTIGDEKQLYVPNKYYQAYTDRYPKREFYKANVVYDINYENSDYQYHSVDYCSYSLTTEQVQFIQTKGSPKWINSSWGEYPTLGKDYLCYNYGKDKWNILDGWKKDENGNEIYTSKIEIIPPAPERDGYTFGGWYKETECINEWDFETDTLPQMQLDENEEIIFQETALYAKWNKEG